MSAKDPWSDNWNEKEGKRFWDGYDQYLDRISTVGDDERTIAMQVLA